MEKAPSKKMVTCESDVMADAIYRKYELQCALRGKEVKDIDFIRKAAQKVGKWLTSEDTKPWLFIIGGVGTGKTTMAQAICSILPSRKMIEATDLAEAARGHEYEWEQVVKRGADYDYLAVDDIGQECTETKEYGNSRYPFVEMVAARYKRMLPVIVTSNLSFVSGDFGRIYGERTEDRIREMADFIVLNSISYR